MKNTIQLILILLLLGVNSCYKDSCPEPTGINDERRKESEWYHSENEKMIISGELIELIQDHPCNDLNCDLYCHFIQDFITEVEINATSDKQYAIRLESDDNNCHPKIELHSEDVNMDDEDEILMIIGDERAWEQLFIFLQKKEEDYELVYSKILGSRYSQPEIEVMSADDAHPLIQLYSSGSAYPGYYGSDYSILMVEEDNVFEVLTLREMCETTRILGSDIRVNLRFGRSTNEIIQDLEVKFKYSFWIKRSRDLDGFVVGANEFSEKYPNWVSGEFNLKNVPNPKPEDDWWSYNGNHVEAGLKKDAEVILLDDSLVFTYEWNELAKKYTPLIQSGQTNPLHFKLNVLQSENKDDYADWFYSIFRNDLLSRAKSIDAKHNLKTSIEFMEYWFGMGHFKKTSDHDP